MPKSYYFGQLKDHNLGSKKGKHRNDAIFYTYSLSSNCLWYSFLYLKIVKIHFHGITSSVNSGLQNTWILEVEAVRSEFCPVWFRKVKKKVLPLTIKFVWSHCPFYFVFVCFSFCSDFVFCFWILFFWIFRYLLSLDIYRPWILCSRSLDVFLSTAEKFHCIAFQIQVLIGTQTISCSEISQENVQFTLQSNCPEKFHKLTRKHRW